MNSNTLLVGVVVRLFLIKRRDRELFLLIVFIIGTVNKKYVDMGSRYLGADSKFFSN